MYKHALKIACIVQVLLDCLVQVMLSFDIVMDYVVLGYLAGFVEVVCKLFKLQDNKFNQ
jgi:uncharacterized membrane protein YhaH (DUF805 family)